VLDQVNLDEDPTFADLGSRYLAGIGLVQQRDRVNLQEGRGFLQGERLHDLLPGTGPTRAAILIHPDESNMAGALVELIDNIARHLAAMADRHGNRLAGDGNAERGAKAMPVKFTMPFRKSLGEILAKIFDDAQPAISLAPLWRLHVDVALSDDMSPDSPEMPNILPTDNRKMPMPCTALLFLWDRDI